MNVKHSVDSFQKRLGLKVWNGKPQLSDYNSMSNMVRPKRNQMARWLSGYYGQTVSGYYPPNKLGILNK